MVYIGKKNGKYIPQKKKGIKSNQKDKKLKTKAKIILYRDKGGKKDMLIYLFFISFKSRSKPIMYCNQNPIHLRLVQRPKDRQMFCPYKIVSRI